MQTGVFWGYVELIDGLVGNDVKAKNMARRSKSSPRAASPRCSKALRRTIEIITIRIVTIRGLYQIWKRNGGVHKS